MPRLLNPGRLRLRVGLLVGALVVSVVTTGCGSSKNSAASASTSASAAPTASTSPTAAGSATAVGGATTVTVTESEFSLQLSSTTFKPGSYTFVAKNTGHVSHALAVSGPGVPTAQTATIEPGGSANLTVTLQPGAYELWCPVDGHKSLGMDTHIQVP